MKVVSKMFTANCFLAVVAISVASPGHCLSQDNEKTIIKMPDLYKGLMGFSFREGKVVPAYAQEEDVLFSTTLDLVWFPPNGLIANNAKSYFPFSGKGGIIDLGKKALDEVKEAPKTGYALQLKPKQIKKGHTYCVLTADGEHYGKIHVLTYDRKKGELTFTWQYQPKPTNVFDKMEKKKVEKSAK
jgi:hypothetical protein